ARRGSFLWVAYTVAMIDPCGGRHPVVRFLCLDAADMTPLPTGSADVIVFSFNGLSGLVPDAKRRACLGECHRILRPGGRFIFSLPNPRALWQRPSFGGARLPERFASLARSLNFLGRRLGQRLLTPPFWIGTVYL